MKFRAGAKSVKKNQPNVERAGAASSAAPATTKKEKKKMPTTTTRDRIVGTRPAHTHVPPSGKEPWKCNSPYCEEMAVEHPDDGGQEPVVQGREPWRGR